MKKKQMAALAVVVLALSLFGLTACTWERDGQKHEPGSNGTAAEKWWKTESTPSDLEEAMREVESKWQKYELGDYSFDYPPGWQVEVSKKINDDDADWYITVKNTDKQVVSGGAAPDDYYIEKDGKNVVNSDKYADVFVMITVDVYKDSSSLDWQSLADKIYPNVVEAFAPYAIDGKLGIEAIRIEKSKGILAGSPRLFIRTKKAVYDVSLQYKNWEQQDAEDLLNKFCVQFPF
ncbi:hypothetical protein HZB94_01025 [Candidatus Falkowbacteria bacterium]|nr:hypothetical protein [Candidatus Falkowbacteria bacterium]